MKYFIERTNLGKYFYYTVKPTSGKKLKELENSGERLFDTRPQALAHMKVLKKGN